MPVFSSPEAGAMTEDAAVRRLPDMEEVFEVSVMAGAACAADWGWKGSSRVIAVVSSGTMDLAGVARGALEAAAF